MITTKTLEIFSQCGNTEENSISIDQAFADKGKHTDTQQLPQIPEEQGNKIIRDYNTIPLADIASPEGAFLRRRISESRQGRIITSCLNNIPKQPPFNLNSLRSY